MARVAATAMASAACAGRRGRFCDAEAGEDEHRRRPLTRLHAERRCRPAHGGACSAEAPGPPPAPQCSLPPPFCPALSLSLSPSLSALAR